MTTDLQEFYELTLLDESKTTQQKTVETLQIASRWELDPPIIATQQQSEVCWCVGGLCFLSGCLNQWIIKYSTLCLGKTWDPQ